MHHVTIMNKWQKIIGIIAGAMVILFLVACYLVMFKPWLFMGPDPEDKYNAIGLYGEVSDLFFIDENTGIAISSLRYSDSQDSVKVFRTSDSGHNWSLVLELPDYSHAFNAIKIDNYVFCAVEKDSVFTLLSMNISSGKYKLSDEQFTTLPNLYQCGSNLGYSTDGVFYTTNSTFEAPDSIGNYDKRPSNKGIAVIGDHIYGFIFDKDSYVNRLYDFKNRNFVCDFSITGNVSIIKTTDSSCVILAVKDQRNLIMYEFDVIDQTLIQKFTYTANIMRPLKIDNGLVYSLVSDGPFADNSLLVGDASGKYETIINLNESNIKAYCLTDRMFYFYDPFQNTIVRSYISETL